MEEKIKQLIQQYNKGGFTQSELELELLNLYAVAGRSEQCAHPRDKREYIGSNMLRCKVCGKEFS